MTHAATPLLFMLRVTTQMKSLMAIVKRMTLRRVAGDGVVSLAVWRAQQQQGREGWDAPLAEPREVNDLAILLVDQARDGLEEHLPGGRVVTGRKGQRAWAWSRRAVSVRTCENVAICRTEKMSIPSGSKRFLPVG